MKWWVIQYISTSLLAGWTSAHNLDRGCREVGYLRNMPGINKPAINAGYKAGGTYLVIHLSLFEGKHGAKGVGRGLLAGGSVVNLLDAAHNLQQECRK